MAFVWLDQKGKPRWGKKGLPKGKWLGQDELKAFVESIVQDEWWAKQSRQSGIRAIGVSFQGNESASVTKNWPLYKEATLNLPPGLWCETVILHELAHIITPIVSRADMHSQEFIENWCAMLERYTDYGEEARAILEEHGFPT